MVTTMIDKTDNRLVFILEKDIATPVEGSTAMVNRWWCHVEGRGLLFMKAGGELIRQCSTCKQTAQLMRDKMFPWADLVFVPLSFLRFAYSVHGPILPANLYDNVINTAERMAASAKNPAAADR